MILISTECLAQDLLWRTMPGEGLIASDSWPNPTLTPDGRFLGYSTGREIVILNTFSGHIVSSAPTSTRFRHRDAEIRSFSFSPDNRTLMLHSQWYDGPSKLHGYSTLWDWQSGTAVWQGGDDLNSSVFSADGESVILMGGKSGVFRTEDGSPVQEFYVPLAGYALAMSADGQNVVCANLVDVGDGPIGTVKIYLWNLSTATGSRINSSARPFRPIYDFSPDSRLLYYPGFTWKSQSELVNTVSVLDVVSMTKVRDIELENSTLQLQALPLASGFALADIQGAVKIYSYPSGELRDSISFSDQKVTSFELAPHGKTILLGLDDGSLRLRHIREDREYWRIGLPDKVLQWYAIHSATGRLYAYFSTTQPNSGDLIAWQFDWEGPETPVLSVAADRTPSGFDLHPNPVRDICCLSWNSPREQWISIRLFDALGVASSSPIRRHVSAGPLKIELETALLPGGIYFCQLIASDGTYTKKFIILR